MDRRSFIGWMSGAVAAIFGSQVSGMTAPPPQAPSGPSNAIKTQQPTAEPPKPCKNQVLVFNPDTGDWMLIEAPCRTISQYDGDGKNEWIPVPLGAEVVKF